MNKEPALLIGATVSVIVALAAIFGVIINPDTLTTVIVALAPVVSAVLIRMKVTPAKAV